MVPRVTNTFEALGLSPLLLEVVAELGYASPTPIQSESIPALLAQKDVIGQSKTGSGKTAAFTLPILERISLTPREVTVLVLCPTRELCTQVAREIRKLARRHAGLQVAILSGGQPISLQKEALTNGAHIAVGTPGRVLDLLKRGSLILQEVTTVVLDEADRMLDMGFQEDVEAILKATPKTRQTILFSATFPRTIEALSRGYQKHPVRVTIEDEVAQSDIRQLAYSVTTEQKLAAVQTLLRAHAPETALLFCNHTASVAALTGEAGGFAATDIGKIEIHDNFAYVAVAKSIAKKAVECLSTGRIKGRRFKAGIAD